MLANLPCGVFGTACMFVGHHQRTNSHLESPCWCRTVVFNRLFFRLYPRRMPNQILNRGDYTSTSTIAQLYSQFQWLDFNLGDCMIKISTSATTLQTLRQQSDSKPRQWRLQVTWLFVLELLLQIYFFVNVAVGHMIAKTCCIQSGAIIVAYLGA